MKEGWYCSTGFKAGCPLDPKWYRKNGCDDCPSCHRKHPTPEQFREEYGREVKWSDPVWVSYNSSIADTGDYEGVWVLMMFQDAEYKVKEYPDSYFDIVCACTPFGMPSDDFEVTE